MIKVGDIVELVDETLYDGIYKGRMTVVVVCPNTVWCVHPESEYRDFYKDDLVVMEEEPNERTFE